MVKIDLITGFLGSGKTTFIKEYAKFLMAQGLSIGILENDYGAVNVDMMLLQDLEGDQCELEMVAGGCHYDCHRRRFKTKLIAMGMCGYDRVLVEPSGIFDVDEFFDILREDPLENWYEIGNVIAIVDAALEEELSEQSEYMLAAQTASAGCIVFSRAQLSGESEMRASISHLNRALEKVNCKRRYEFPQQNQKADVYAEDWFAAGSDLFEKVKTCGYHLHSHVKLPVDRENAYESVYFMNLTFSREMLMQIAQKIFADTAYGKVFRIKGFVQDADRWYEFNATKKGITDREIAKGQSVVIVIGEELNREKMEELFGMKAASVNQ